MADKTCQKCDTTKDQEEFYRDRTRKSGRSPYCKTCGKAATTAWAKKNPERRAAIRARWEAENPEKRAVADARWRAANRKQIAANNARYSQENPAKRRANGALNGAVRYGRLTREPCEECGAEPADGHHDSYLPEHRLDVRWLCRKHHMAHHKAEATS